MYPASTHAPTYRPHGLPRNTPLPPHPHPVFSLPLARLLVAVAVSSYAACWPAARGAAPEELMAGRSCQGSKNGGVFPSPGWRAAVSMNEQNPQPSPQPIL